MYDVTGLGAREVRIPLRGPMCITITIVLLLLLLLLLVVVEIVGFGFLGSLSLWLV